MTSTMTFCRTIAAVEACRITMEEQQRIAAATSSHRLNQEQYFVHRTASVAHANARRDALAAYAEELLPAVLGGCWHCARRGSLIPYHRPTEAALFGPPLIDHAVNFRRANAKGPLTWRNGVLLTEPYDALDRNGQPQPGAAAQARRLRAEFSIAVWASRPLSRWYPGWTALLILARDLRPADAARFGFIALA